MAAIFVTEMKYELRIFSRANGSIQEKHEKLIDEWLSLSPRWQLVGVPQIGVIKEDSFATVTVLGRNLPRGLKGSLTYYARSECKEGQTWQDSLVLSFDPKKINYKGVLDELIPSLERAFNADMAYLFDHEIDARRFSAMGDCIKIGAGAEWKMSPVCFLSDGEIGAMYQLTVEEYVQRLTGRVEQVTRTSRGVYFISTYNILEVDQFEETRNELEGLLRTRRRSWKFWK